MMRFRKYFLRHALRQFFMIALISGAFLPRVPHGRYEEPHLRLGQIGHELLLAIANIIKTKHSLNSSHSSALLGESFQFFTYALIITLLALGLSWVLIKLRGKTALRTNTRTSLILSVPLIFWLYIASHWSSSLNHLLPWFIIVVLSCLQWYRYLKECAVPALEIQTIFYHFPMSLSVNMSGIFLSQMVLGQTGFGGMVYKLIITARHLEVSLILAIVFILFLMIQDLFEILSSHHTQGENT